MNKKNCTLSTKMVSTKSKHKVLTCSTPEHRPESPSRDSDSLCDSEAASPVPFFCTQDGAEGETDVVWNFYTPKSDNAPSSRIKNSTPLSRRIEKSRKYKPVDKPVPKRKPVRPSQKKTELFQDLLELNQNLHELMAKKSSSFTEKRQSGSEEDIFNDSGSSSPKSGLRTNSRCLRRNVLSSKFTKAEPEAALESDDSMNECLIKASQVVEEKFLNPEPAPAKKRCLEINIRDCRGPAININNDSMDAILNNINLDSPLVSKSKRFDSPKMNNDSFDSLVGNLNDSILDRISQVPLRESAKKNRVHQTRSDWTVKEVMLHDGSPTNKSIFGRHNSMPESPSMPENKPSTSGMSFGRYNSMPFSKNGDSPIRCTPDEIKRKHQQAREKLLAKRLLPFTSSQQLSNTQPSQILSEPKRARFQPRVASAIVKPQKSMPQTSQPNNSLDLKQLIEKKRQEALMKLRRRQPQTKP